MLKAKMSLTSVLHPRQGLSPLLLPAIISVSPNAYLCSLLVENSITCYSGMYVDVGRCGLLLYAFHTH